MDLKSCPFCGTKVRLLGGPEAQETYSIWCERGHSFDGSFDLQTTLESWNARAPAADAAEARVSVKAACRAAAEKQLIHGALSLQGKTAVEQADAVLAAIDAVEVR